MKTGLLRLIGLLCLAVAAWGGTYPFTFNSPILCYTQPSSGSCYTSTSMPPGTPYGFAGIDGRSTCASGALPEASMAVAAQYCSFDTLLTAAVDTNTVQYYDSYLGQIVQADNIKATAASYFYVGGLPYLYWTSNRQSDCYDDAIRENILGGRTC
jgi:hypothetical protein